MSIARRDYVTARMAAAVHARFASFLLQAKDPRFLPPKTILNGVDEGELSEKVLQIWQLVAEKMLDGKPAGSDLNYAGATVYFRNKCSKMGVPLPEKYQSGGKGAKFGRFKIMDADQIEDWVKERMKSAGLLEDAQQAIQTQAAEVAAVQTSIEDLLKKSLDAEHQKQLATAAKEVEAAAQALTTLEKAVEKHEDVDAPVISFEQEFQKLLDSALNDLSRKQVLAQAKAVLAKFEAGMNTRQAGVMDTLSKWLDKLVGAFKAIKAWAADLVKSADKIENLFASVK